MARVKQWLYYCVIGVISFVALVFLPMVGSEVGMGWNLPTTPVGWVVYVATKLIVATINVLLFHCFMQQAKLNSSSNEKYKAANEMLYKIAPQIYDPRSPLKFNKQEYGRKGVIIFVTTLLSAFALTQAILSFDYMSMLTYLFTIIMGVVFGIIQMKKAEVYWTQEYYDFAVKFVTAHHKKVTEKVTETEVKTDDNCEQQTIQESGRTSTEE